MLARRATSSGGGWGGCPPATSFSHPRCCLACGRGRRRKLSPEKRANPNINPTIVSRFHLMYKLSVGIDKTCHLYKLTIEDQRNASQQAVALSVVSLSGLSAELYRLASKL